MSKKTFTVEIVRDLEAPSIRVTVTENEGQRRTARCGYALSMAEIRLAKFDHWAFMENKAVDQCFRQLTAGETK